MLIYLLSKNIRISVDYQEDSVLPYQIIERANQESKNDINLMIEESQKYLNNLEDKEENINFGFSNRSIPLNDKKS